MALTINIVNAPFNTQAVGNVPTGAVIVEPTLTPGATGVVGRSNTPPFLLAASAIRNAVELTGYSDFTTELTTAVTTYLGERYAVTESITFDVVIKAVTDINDDASKYGLGTEQYSTVVIIYEKRD